MTSLKWSIEGRFSAKLTDTGHLNLVFRTAMNGTQFIAIPLDAVVVQTHDLPTTIDDLEGFVVTYTDKEGRSFKLAVSSKLHEELDLVVVAVRDVLFEVFSGESLES